MSTPTLLERAQHVQRLHLKCEDILRHANTFARARWQAPTAKCAAGFFSDSPTFSTDGPHVINTSTALVCIADHPEVFDRRQLEAFEKCSFARISRYYADAYADAGGWISREGTWSPYATAWSLRALSSWGRMAGKDECDKHIDAKGKLRKAVQSETKKLITFLEDWTKDSLSASVLDFDHTYFVYSAIEALEAVMTLNKQCGALLDDDIKNTYRAAKALTLGKMALEFYRQMTYRAADIAHHLDPASLAISLYCLVQYQVDGAEVPEDVLAAAIDAVFGLQRPTGFWDTGNPLLGSNTGLVGCSSVELAICLLKNGRTSKYFAKYSENFNRLLSYLHLSFDDADPGNGWPTDIRRRDTGRQTWYGFMVFAFLSVMSDKLRNLAADDLLRDFDRREGQPEVPWSEVLDYLGFKAKIQTALIDSRRLPDKKDRRYSAILFGPPGTGKSSIAHALATELDYRFIEIGCGDFLRHGVDGIFAQGEEIFRRLMLAERAVVLFDEMDELVLARDHTKEKVSRFLTTFMLPWLQRLRSRREIIFLFATNQIEYYDPAVRRPGRFDLVLPVGPPQDDQRLEWLKRIKVELDAGALIQLRDAIPHRATLGEIKHAWMAAKASGGDVKTRMLDALKGPRLLIRGQEWKEFRGHCARFGNVNADAFADADEDEGKK